MAYNRNKYGGGLGDDKTWNMDALFTERINQRLNELDIVTCDADQSGRYRLLNTIFISTHFKYKEHGTSLKDKFLNVKNILHTTPSTSSRQAQAQHQSIVITKAEQMLDDLHFEIVNLLYESDLICLKIKPGMNPELEFERDYK